MRVVSRACCRSWRLLGAGVALALSGHASNAAPQWLTRPSVFVHVVCVAFWVGALLPLIAAVQAGAGGAALARFSRVIPYPLAALVISGRILAVVQLDRSDALWTTSYGIVLSCKLAAVTALLALGAANRYVFVPRYQAGMRRAQPAADAHDDGRALHRRRDPRAGGDCGGSRRRRARSRPPSRSRSICTASAPWRRCR